MHLDDDDGRGRPWMDPYAAKQDLLKRHKENEPLFDDAQKDLARQLEPLVRAAHPCGRTWAPNCRATKITVKADGYRSRDRLATEFDRLVVFCDEHGIEATYNKGGSAIYSIKKR